MSSPDRPADLATELTTELPYLRRYARALTGSQDTGDRYALATLEAIVADPSAMDSSQPTKVRLFNAFHKIWSTSGTPVEPQEDVTDLLEARAQWRLSQLTPNSREALLLHTLEEFSYDAIGTIMDLSPDEAKELVDRAKSEMAEMVTGKVLIIEDEGIIAMDLRAIVSDMGHEVTGIARTRDEAFEKGKETVPDLILADIQLADKSSGIDAVNALLAELGDRPVIFITAFPERLLTGERPEPAFLITKPYSEDQVRAAVGQGMFFASSERIELA
ncbi:response regulator [Lutimaribacter marinistellae]|uniref:Response regulator n=1 Tax=Lutimaribacter marinistellae TaxID=1820329 RepID=A0ABV7TQ16_9RHOB